MLNNSCFAELHRHLQGSIPIDTLQRLHDGYSFAEISSRAPKQIQERFFTKANILKYQNTLNLNDLLSYDSFDDFIAAYIYSVFIVINQSRLKECCQDIIQDLHKQNISYVELIVAPAEYKLTGISLPECLEVLKHTTQIAKAQHNIEIQWLLDPIRNLGPQHALDLLQQIKSLGTWPFIGVTLGGSEALFPANPFIHFFKAANKLGLHLSIHAGETLGPESIHFAINNLGVERIGHGIRAIEDQQLMKILAKKQIPLEVCVTANLQTKIYPCLKAHPLAALYQAGIPITVNTDDPTFFRTDLNTEFKLLEELGLTESNIQEIKTNAWKFKFA